MALDIPRDRSGSFTPQFVPKGVRRMPGFDQTVVLLYARGPTTRELQAYLEERYQVDVSPDLISTVTIKGDSYRLREKRKAGLIRATVTLNPRSDSTGWGI